MAQKQSVSPETDLDRAEREIKAGLYHEALEDVEACINHRGADEQTLYLRGVARVKYGIPYLFELGMADLAKAAAFGNDRASELVQRLGGLLAA
jgi:hypothetical protein